MNCLWDKPIGYLGLWIGPKNNLVLSRYWHASWSALILSHATHSNTVVAWLSWWPFTWCQSRANGHHCIHSWQAKMMSACGSLVSTGWSCCIWNNVDFQLHAIWHFSQMVFGWKCVSMIKILTRPQSSLQNALWSSLYLGVIIHPTIQCTKDCPSTIQAAMPCLVLKDPLLMAKPCPWLSSPCSSAYSPLVFILPCHVWNSSSCHSCCRGIAWVKALWSIMPSPVNTSCVPCLTTIALHNCDINGCWPSQRVVAINAQVLDWCGVILNSNHLLEQTCHKQLLTAL